MVRLGYGRRESFVSLSSDSLRGATVGWPVCLLEVTCKRVMRPWHGHANCYPCEEGPSHLEELPVVRHASCAALTSQRTWPDQGRHQPAPRRSLGARGSSALTSAYFLVSAAVASRPLDTAGRRRAATGPPGQEMLRPPTTFDDSSEGDQPCASPARRPSSYSLSLSTLSFPSIKA